MTLVTFVNAQWKSVCQRKIVWKRKKEEKHSIENRKKLTSDTDREKRTNKRLVEQMNKHNLIAIGYEFLLSDSKNEKRTTI